MEARGGRLLPRDASSEHRGRGGGRRVRPRPLVSGAACRCGSVMGAARRAHGAGCSGASASAAWPPCSWRRTCSIFGVFVLLPVAINVLYSFTGGTAIFFESRHYRRRSTSTARCSLAANYHDAARPAGRTRSGRASTTPCSSSSSQVTGAGARRRSVTALVLNREMRGRGFWRAVFFFPVLLSPVVVGTDLEMDPAARRAAQRAAGASSASSAPSGWPSAAGRCSGRSSSRSGRISASTR